MSAENVDVVRRFTEAIAEQDEVLLELVDPGIDVVDHDIPDAGTYHGHAGVGAWLEDWSDAWESWSIEPEQYIDAGTAVVGVFAVTARGKGSGAETQRRNATVCVVEHGLLKRIEYYSTREAALEAAGLKA